MPNSEKGALRVRQPQTTLSNGIESTDLIQIRKEIGEISERLAALSHDIGYLKEIFVAKEAKRTRRRERKEKKQRELERQLKAQERRAEYEEIVWDMRRRPWDFMPAPTSRLSPKELQVLSHMAQNRSDQEIALRMEIKETSITPRVCDLKKKLGVASRQDLVTFYLQYQKAFRDHRHQRCIKILSWLLHPPPGFIRESDFTLVWKRSLGRG
jgi:DNA-binding CsgD family transcriptional regulator